MIGLSIFIWIIIIVLWFFGIICTGAYADRLGRSIGAFVFLAFICSPFFVAFILFMLGETDEHRKARIIEEEKWRRSCSTETSQNNEEQKENIVDILS